MVDITPTSERAPITHNDNVLAEGFYSLESQSYDYITNNSITVRESMYNEMTREKTMAEQKEIADFLIANAVADSMEKQDFFSRVGAGWEVASIQEEISRDANAIRSIRAKGGDKELEDALMDRIARNKWRQSQVTLPEDTGMWSAYNIGAGIRSMAPGFLIEIPFAVGEGFISGLFASPGGPVTSLTAASIAAGRRIIRARKIAKGAYAATKAATMWAAFSQREQGGMYADIMDRTDLTEDQKQAMAITYGRLSGAVELLGWNLGAGGLAMKGVKAVSKKFAAPIEKWTADAAFKNAIKTQMKQEAEKAAGSRIVTAAIKGGARVAGGTASDVMEEGTQRALESAAIEQGLEGRTPTTLSVVGEGFRKLAGVPVELVQGKLSEQSIAILDAMGSALLPSAMVGGAGYLLSTASSYGTEVSPADTGRISGYTIKNNALKSALLSAEKNVARLTAVSNYMGDQSKTTDFKLQLIDGMVKNAEIEGAVHFAPEDTEVLLALGEAKPTLKNTLTRLGITKAIQEGKKTGTVSIPMRAFAELAAQPEIREGEVGKRLNISGTVSLEDSSYSRIERSVIAGQKKGKELLEKPSPKFEQKLNGLRRRFKAAGYTDVEIEANITELAKGVATLVEASNGAMTADEALDEFKFNIEKRDYDLSLEGLKKKKGVRDDAAIGNIISKFTADTRETFGYFRRILERGRKPLPKDVSKMNVESVAAEMAAIDAKEKEYAGETIMIKGKERSVYNSHGVRIAKSAKALKAFYKWFGDSKAVDEMGRPKVLYHGTPRASFLSFMSQDGKPRFFFTDDISIAETYSGSSNIVTREEAESAAAGDVDPSSGIYQVYLKLENPAEVDYNGKSWAGDEQMMLNIRLEDGSLALDKDGEPITITSIEEASEFFKSGEYGQASLVPAPGIIASTDMESKKAMVRGRDGAILKNVLDVGDMARHQENEYPTSNVYVVFEPEQIKSTDNYGMFDPEAVNMYRSVIRTAYTGSPVDYLLPALKAIGTGEGHYAHGWGLYYALRFDVADRYRRRYQKSGMYVTWGGEDVDDLYWDVTLKYKESNIPVEILRLIRAAVDDTVKRKSDIVKYNNELRQIQEQMQMWAEKLDASRRQAFYRNKGFELLKLSDEQILLQYVEEDAAFFKLSVVRAMNMSEQEIVANKKQAIENIKWLKNRAQEVKDNVQKQDIKEIRENIKKHVVDSINQGISWDEEKIETQNRHMNHFIKYADEISAKLSRMKDNYKEAVAKRKEEIKASLDPDTKLTESVIKEMAVNDVDSNIEDLREGLNNTRKLIEDTKRYIQDNKDEIDTLKSRLAFVSKKGFFNKITIVDNTNVGQVKEVTVRKIDTFMRENNTLSNQHGVVKRALIKMLSSEAELAEKFSLPDFSDAFLMMDRDEQEAFKAKVKKKAAAALKHIPSEFVEEAVNNAFTQFTVYGRNEEEAVAAFANQMDSFPKDSTIYREYEAKIQAVKALWPYVKESALELVSDFFFVRHTGRTFYTGLANIFLGKEPWDSGGKYEKKEVHEAKKKASLMLQKYGINGISYNGREDGECLVVFDSSVLRVKESYYSRRKGASEDVPESEFDLFSENAGVRGPKELFVSSHSDITTFAHEVMHFVTRGLIEMYNDGSISEVWKREVDKLYDYFSTMPSHRGPSAMHKKNGKIIMEKEASETLSGGFQQYIEQGKASDSSLKKLYAFIKDLAADLWAVLNRGYYKDQALSDPQIAFYDRVMSAHTDVKNTEYKYGYAPLEKLPGVSDQEYEEYTIERKVARAKSSNNLFKAQRQMVKNRKRAEWIKFYEEEFVKALAELRGEPEYAVMQFIKDNGGLNKESFMSGTDLWASVPQRHFSKKDGEGVTVEQLTAKFGPEITIADIAKILASMPSLDVAARRRARTEADRRFLEEFDPAADVTPANAMRTILFIRSLVKESLMIKGEPLSSFPAHYSVWIKEAENYFMGLTVKNAKDLEKWANMESRVTDDFMTALTGGDTDQASLKADQRAMVNYVLVRSKQLRKLEASFKRRFKKFYNAPQGKDIKTMDGVTWNLIHTILQEYGFTRKAGRLSASAREQFTAWVEARKGKKYFPYETLVNEIGLLSSIPKNTSLTVEHFNRVVALVETIRAIGEAEKRVFDGEKRQQLDVVAGEIIDNIMKIRAAKGDKAFLAYGKGSLSRLTVPQMGMLEPLFGAIGMRKLYVALRNALVARDDLADNTRSFIADSFERNGMGNLLADKREFLVGNRTVNNNILLFALQHSGNDHNRDNAIKTLQQYYKDESFSEAEFEDFLNASPIGMRNYVNDLWAMFKNIKTLIDEQTRVATGELIATVEPKAYTLRDGTQMSGGYFPAKKINKVGITDPLDTYYDNNFLYPRAGLLKDRIKNATGNLDLSQDSLSRWIFQAVNLATTQVAFNDIASIFQDEGVINALGPNASMVTQYVNDWLQAAVMPIAPQPKVLRAIAKGPTVVFLGFKAVSGLVQLLGTLVGLNEVSLSSLVASSGKLLNVGKYFKISEEMSKRSAFMADRARKFDSRFFGLMKDENMLQKATRKYGDGIVAASMSFVRTFQCMADMVVWDGAFADAKKNGMSDKDASDHADYVVMKTQGDRVQMNTPEGFQGVLRFFQPFMTYILTLSQMGNAALRSKQFKKFGTLVALIVLSNALEAYFKENDKEWRRKLLGKKTKGTDEDFWQRYRNRFLVQTVSTLGDVAFPFAGLGGTLSLTLTEDMLKSVSPGYRAYSAGETPAVEVVTKAAKAITLDEDTWKSIYDWDMSLGANLVDFVL